MNKEIAMNAAKERGGFIVCLDTEHIAKVKEGDYSNLPPGTRGVFEDIGWLVTQGWLIHVDKGSPTFVYYEITEAGRNVDVQSIAQQEDKRSARVSRKRPL